MKLDQRTENIELRANSEAELLAALPSEMIGLDEDGATILIKATHEWALDWNIPVVLTAPVFDNSEPPVIITPAVMSNKFHANLRLLRGKVVTIGSQFKINPVTPSREWAQLRLVQP